MAPDAPLAADVDALIGALRKAAALFGVGLYGLLQRRSLVAMLISVELMTAAVASLGFLPMALNTGFGAVLTINYDVTPCPVVITAQPVLTPVGTIFTGQPFSTWFSYRL